MVKSNCKNINEEKHRSRRLSIKEGMLWSIRSAFGDNYLAPFAIALKTPDALVAIINSTWNLNSMGQLIGGKLIDKYKRKSILTKAVFLDSISWLFLALIGFFYIKGLFLPILPYLIILSLGLVVLAGGIGNPSWISMMGDIVDSKYRGKWFSKRTTIISFSTIILGILSSLLITHFKNIGFEIAGLCIFFIIAFIGRFSCIKLLNNQYCRVRKKTKKSTYSFRKFLKDINKTNFGKYTIFRMAFSISIYITSPLTAVYLLRYVGLGYTTYMIATLSGTFFTIILLNLWGRINDRHGSYFTIALTTIIVPLTPLLWILSTNKIYLMIIPGLIGGTSWNAFMMASRNFMYDNIDKGKRAKTSSYFNTLNGGAAIIGGLIGALLIKTIHTTSIEPIILIFIIGAFCRMLSVAIFVPKLREQKKKKRLKDMQELEEEIIKDVKPTFIEDIHDLTSIPKYLKTS